jgi:hypothetical protein
VVGEVKWHEGTPRAATVGEAAAALEAKGVPPGVEGTVVRVVFVPVRPPGGRESRDAVVVDAADVLAALRDDA